MSETHERTTWNARKSHRHGTYRTGRPLLHPGPWTPAELNDLRMVDNADRNDKIPFNCAVPAGQLPVRLWRNRRR